MFTSPLHAFAGPEDDKAAPGGKSGSKVSGHEKGGRTSAGKSENIAKSLTIHEHEDGHHSVQDHAMGSHEHFDTKQEAMDQVDKVLSPAAGEEAEERHESMSKEAGHASKSNKEAHLGIY